MGRLSLIQGIFPTQGSNPGLPHCRWILYQLSHREAQEHWRGRLSLLCWIFPTQESNQGLLHCRRILNQLSYQRSPSTWCYYQVRGGGILRGREGTSAGAEGSWKPEYNCLLRCPRARPQGTSVPMQEGKLAKAESSSFAPGLIKPWAQFSAFSVL